LSKISKEFQFDRELFLSKVYERALRSSLMESLRRQQADIESTKSPAIPRMTRLELENQAKRSRAVDLLLKRDRRPPELKVLLLGGPESETETIAMQLKIMHGNDHSAEELTVYRDRVRRTVLRDMRVVIEHLRETGIELDNEDMNHAEIILQEIGKNKACVTEITPATANAMESLWDSPQFLSFFHEAIASDSIYVSNSAK
jgi:guanine nucleotide-binding protein G(i) subunit alpha